MPIAYVKSSISSTESRRNPTKCWGISFIVSSIFGAIFMIGGLAILMSMPYVIENLIRTEHNLADGTSLYKKWVDPEYIIDLNIWTHSIQNPDNITVGMKPRVVNKGPYVFDERQYKKILSKGNGTIKYQNYMTYFYNEQKSCQNCSLANDHVWIPNLVYQKFVLAASNPLTKVASTALQLQTPFLDVKTKELFFVGYVDPFLDQICSLPFMNIICESMLNMPDRIGLLYERNGTHEGDYLVSDGTHDRSKSLGKIIAWNGRKTVPSSWWSTTQASMINGTDGGLVHPYVTKDERIYIFSTFICRSIYLTFQKEFDYEGVNAYKFGVPKDAWNYEKPEHTGYCHKTTKVYFDHQTPGCLPNGLMDLSRCLKGKPDIVASMPNFYDAPDSVRDMIEGLDEPNAESDQIYLVVEPRLGTLLKASRRLQVNFGIHSGANISNFAYPRMKAGIIPVITLRENIKIDASNLNEIKERLYKVEETAFWASCLAIMIGSLLIALGIMCCCCFHRSRTMGTIKIHDQSI